MTAISDEHRAMLVARLDQDFVPHLPPMLAPPAQPAEAAQKNRGRAFNAFALHHTLGVSAEDAAYAVVDDMNDRGVDLIYYDAASETLYIGQGKLGPGEFGQTEALPYCSAVKKLIAGDFVGFNQHITSRQPEIEDALELCSRIQPLIAYVGSGVSQHAKDALDELTKQDADHGDERVQPPLVYDAARCVADMVASKAHDKVNEKLCLYKKEKMPGPRVAYSGLVKLGDLAELHRKAGPGLYDRNIRHYLGSRSDVNAAIEATLQNTPEDFVFFNNGVTALCDSLRPGRKLGDCVKLDIRGLSIVNGAQTVATAAELASARPPIDISDARVAFTVIVADRTGEFGKAVTRARNHQNPVLSSQFAALDEEQERLRRELALLGVRYVYKAERADVAMPGAVITIEEAAQALAMHSTDPRFVVWAKQQPAALLNTFGPQYPVLFNATTSATALANAVRVCRLVDARVAAAASATTGAERLAYRHGTFAVRWAFLRELRDAVSSGVLLSEANLATAASAPLDKLRQAVWDSTQNAIGYEPLPAPTWEPGPLAVFRSLAYTIPLMEDLLTRHYGLGTDPTVAAISARTAPGDPYPIALFNYLIGKAPQIAVPA